MKNIPADRNFQFWEYKVSHGSLLIRSPKKGEQRDNVDIKFYGVEYVSLARHMGTVELCDSNEKDLVFLRRILDKSVDAQRVYILKTRTARHLVVAAKMVVEEHDGDIFDSPFS